MRATWLLLPSLALGTACLRKTEFKCATNDQCGPNGVCETIGYCSFPDSECGRRFGDSAGDYANKCVGGDVPGEDSGIDAPTGPDAPAATCPSNFTPLTGGNPNHVYRKAQGNDKWLAQDTQCRGLSTRAYFAVPDDLTELGALATFAGAASFWVGINDRANEGVFVLSSGGTFMNTVPWATGEPDDPGNGQDCVAATATNIRTEDCTGNGSPDLPAVCECVLP